MLELGQRGSVASKSQRPPTTQPIQLAFDAGRTRPGAQAFRRGLYSSHRLSSTLLLAAPACSDSSGRASQDLGCPVGSVETDSSTAG